MLDSEDMSMDETKSKELNLLEAHVGNLTGELKDGINQLRAAKNTYRLWWMSWTLGTGFTININNNTKFDVGYSYKVLGKIPLGNKKLDFIQGSQIQLEDISICYHSVHFGVRFYL